MRPHARDVARIAAVLQSEEQELNAFFQFPKWFPKPSTATYRILLENLVKARGWPEAFPLITLRNWIDCALEFYANPEDPSAGNFDDAMLRDFQPLELPLIFVLARHEYAASLAPKAGLSFLADATAGHGYVVQKQRSAGGLQSGAVRQAKQISRNDKIVAHVKMLAKLGYLKHEWAKRAASKFGVSVETARTAIRKSGLYQNPVKRTQRKRA